MKPILEVKNLRTSFQSDWGNKEALDGVSFAVYPGEILCLVGESGSGKSVTALSLMGLLPRNATVTAGEALYGGQNLLALNDRQMDKIRGASISMIFQDAMSSLNPAFTVGDQVKEAVLAHRRMSMQDAEREAVSLLAEAGLPDPEKLLKRYPHSLSGGMRQRVMIAIALAGDPELLIADEATTALDVTIQEKIMKRLRVLAKSRNLSIILITHDIGLVAEMADRVIVMYAGQIVESSGVHELFSSAMHPYTKGLMQAVPSIYDDKSRRLHSIPGTIPENYSTLTGCRFASRCPYYEAACEYTQKLLCLDGNENPIDTLEQPCHRVRCHKAHAIKAMEAGGENGRE